MSNIHIHSTLSGVASLLEGAVYVVMDNNLKHLSGYFNKCNIIFTETSERLKTLQSVSDIACRLLESGADRNAFIIGVGGGITTDVTGLVASIYKRGVKFAFVPTTLLAQVDASIGGKNGVNLESYKNILGVINQPQWVYICAEVLSSLSSAEFRAGVAEVLKTFILFDKEYYKKAVDYFTETEEYLQKNGSYLCGENLNKFYKEEVLLDIIGRCAEYKSGVVKRDEFERGERRLLNLGHTFAHSIEKVCSNLSDYCPIMHGEAVAIGMVMASEIAVKYFKTDGVFARKLREDLARCGLPVKVPCSRCGEPIPVKELTDALKKDKKVAGDAIHFILPKDVADVEDVLISLKDVEELSNDLCEC